MTYQSGFGDHPGQENRRPLRTVDVETAAVSALARLRLAAAGRPESSAAQVIQADLGAVHQIHDLDGRPLFYDVDLVAREAPTGTVRLAAAEEIGASLVSVETRPRRWDPDEALERAGEAATRLHPGAKVVGTTLVCYCYPKIGVRVEMQDESGARTVVLLDASDLLPVVNFGADEAEGSTAYSYYARVVEPTVERRLRRFSREQENLALVGRIVPELLDPSTKIVDHHMYGRLKAETLFPFPLNEERILPYAPRCSGHTCFDLRAQQTNVYCAVAAGQMILDWHRWYFTQDEIAAAMGTHSGGTSNDGQVAGYEALTTFNATFDGTAAWSEAKAEIKAGRPLKSGIPGHARACAGYQRTFNWVSYSYDLALRIYDPWPWNADICQGGAVYWEDWDAIDHTNWIFVRHA